MAGRSVTALGAPWDICVALYLIPILWTRWQQLGVVLLHLRGGRKRGASGLLDQRLFLSFSLSSSALELRNPEKSAFSFVLNLPAQLPASLLTRGSTAHTSHHLLSGSRDTGSDQVEPEGSFKKKRRKRKHRSIDRSPCAVAVKDRDEVSSPPKKERIGSPEGFKDKDSRPPRKESIGSQKDLMSFMGKEVADKGLSHGPVCQDMKSGPKQHVPEPGIDLGMEPTFLLKRKKKKKNRSKDRPLKKTEECSSGMLSLDR